MNDPATERRIRATTDVTTRATKMLEAMTADELRAELANVTTRLHQQQSRENKLRYDFADQARELQTTLDTERLHFTRCVTEARYETSQWKQNAHAEAAACLQLEKQLDASWSPFEVIALQIAEALLLGAITWLAYDSGWRP